MGVNHRPTTALPEKRSASAIKIMQRPANPYALNRPLFGALRQVPFLLIEIYISQRAVRIEKILPPNVHMRFFATAKAIEMKRPILLFSAK